MAASEGTRYHEACHALVAYSLGMLHCCGMALTSDQEACVFVYEASERTEWWCVNRAAIKLAAPVGRIRQQDQEMCWDVMSDTPEYHSDFGEALVILRNYLGLNPLAGSSNELVWLVGRSCSVALNLIEANLGAIQGLVDATEGQDCFSGAQIAHLFQQFGVEPEKPFQCPGNLQT
jgi:hypothetical protein